MSGPSKKMKAALNGVISQENDLEARVTKLEEADKRGRQPFEDDEA
jgi:hypothetical protein